MRMSLQHNDECTTEAQCLKTELPGLVSQGSTIDMIMMCGSIAILVYLSMQMYRMFLFLSYA